MKMLLATRSQDYRKGGAIGGIMIAILISLFLTSCAANSGRTGATVPAISAVDFRAQNIERVREGVLGLMGEDSAGLAVKEYIRAFEEDLSMRIPAQAAMPAETVQVPVPKFNAEWLWDGARREATRRIIADNARASNTVPPEIVELKRWLDGRRMEAIGDLHRLNREFLSAHKATTAKMGLAAAYVAVSCANEPNEVETITALVEPLLTELNTQ